MQMGVKPNVIKIMIEQHKIFEHILKSPKSHARFLNTLALMELSGAQRLSSLVPYLGTTTFFLEHVAEEYRHAYFLRRLAEKVGGREILSFSQGEIYCPRLSRSYITNLQRKVCLELKSAGLNQAHNLRRGAYLLSTYAIETRALPFYQAYQRAIDKAQIGISLRSIISEEEDHLRVIRLQLLQDPELNSLSNKSLSLEQKLFEQWVFQILHQEQDRQ